MSNYHYCYLCASDEGLLLDIFSDGGKTISQNIETCLAVKIQQSNALSTKICHKCAYELDACSKFVQKYRQSRDGSDSRPKRQCSLCSEPGKKGYIFDCKDGNRVNGLGHKIREVFDDNIFKDKFTSLSICLNCRYNLDVLFDLKCIYETTPDKLQRLKGEGAELSDFPKTKTRVVSRKTTYTLPPKLNGVEVSDTDSSSIASMPLKRKRGRPRKDSATLSSPVFRTCEECDNFVEGDLGMYRYHRTGRTVCRDCWLSLDPEKITRLKKKKLGIASGEVGTRRCAILLKDVLSNPAKYENIYKVEKDAQGNKTYIVTDDSSENEEREKTPVKKARKTNISEIRAALLAKARASKRTASTRSDDVEDEPPAKVKITGKKVEEEKPMSTRSLRTRNGAAASDTEVFSSRTRAASSTDKKSTKNAKSDAEIAKPLPKKRGRPLKTPQNNSETPVDSSSTETKIPASRSRRAVKIATVPVSSAKQPERPTRKTRATSLTSEETTSLSQRLETTSLSQRLETLSENVETVPKAVSPPAKSRRSKTKSLSPKNSGSEVELENPYICSVCHVEYKNKLIGMKHELTHAKQPEVILERVAIPEIVVTDAPQTEATSVLVEEPEEQSHDVSSTSENQTEDPEKPAATNDEASTDVFAETNENNEDKEALEENERLPEANETSAEIGEEKNEKEETVEDETEEVTKTVEDKEADDDNEEITKEDTNDAIEEHKTNEEQETTDNIEETNEDSEKVEEATVEEVAEEVEAAEEAPEEGVPEEEAPGKELPEKEAPGEGLPEKEAPEEEVPEKEAPEEAVPEENAPGEVANESAETPTNLNGVEDDAQSEIGETNEEEKEETAVENDAEFKLADTCNPDESLDDERVTSTAQENNAENKDGEDNGDDKQEEETTRNLEEETTGNLEEETTRNLEEEMTRHSEEETTKNLEEETIRNSEEETTRNSEEETIRNSEEETTRNSQEETTRDLPEETTRDLPEETTTNLPEETTRDLPEETTTNLPEETTTNLPEETPRDLPEDTTRDLPEETTRDSEEETTRDLEQETRDEEVSENAKKTVNESETIVKDILTEVFDLATAEVLKRMENAKPTTDKSETSLDETLENISREICNTSADMPSLEPADEESKKLL